MSTLESPQEKWNWVRIGDIGEPTYVFDNYQQFVDINPRFININSLRDLRDHIKQVQNDWCSPTSCHFGLPDAAWKEFYEGVTDCFLDLPQDATESIFYCDSQGCVNWELNSDGRVSVQDQDQDDKIYVAHNLPEFLSRMDFENRSRFEKLRKLRLLCNS